MEKSFSEKLHEEHTAVLNSLQGRTHEIDKYTKSIKEYFESSKQLENHKNIVIENQEGKIKSNQLILDSLISEITSRKLQLSKIDLDIDTKLKFIKEAMNEYAIREDKMRNVIKSLSTERARLFSENKVIRKNK